MNWQPWAGPAIGLAALLFAIYTYSKNRKPKRLQYEIRTDQAIVSHDRHTRWAALSVRFGDRDLKRPRVVIVRVTNTGKIEARPNDFDRPLAVEAITGTEIIAATIVLRQKDTEESQELEPQLTLPTEIVAPRVLLNEGEWLEFRLLVDGDKGSVRTQGRVAGFSFSSHATRRRFSGSLVGMVAPMIAAALVAALPFLALTHDSSVEFPPPPPPIPVPDLVGKPIEQAVNQINEAGLNLGTVNRAPSSAPAGSVISESPPAGKEVSTGAEITLVVSDGR